MYLEINFACIFYVYCSEANLASLLLKQQRGAPVAGAEIPLSSVVETMVRQAVPLQSMEVNGGADIHL